MTQRIIDWPVQMRPGAQEWELLQPKASATSAFSGATFDKLIGPPRWAFSMDLTAAPAKQLPQIEATLRQLRGGLNLLRIGDMRHTGKQSIAPGAERWALNLLPWSGQMQRWAVAGPSPAAAPGGVLRVEKATGIASFTAEPMRAGFRYVVCINVESDASAKVAFSISGGATGAQMGVVFDALTGAETSRFGPMVAFGKRKLPDGWQAWIVLDCIKDSQPQVQLHALLATRDTADIRFSKPVSALAASGVPPTYVETSAGAKYAELAVVADGSDQSGDTLKTRGWIPGCKIRAGCWINYGDGLHQVLSAAEADNGGRASLWVEPPIRRSPLDGQPVSIRFVMGLFKLKDSPKIRQEGMLVPGFTLSFEEYLA